MSSEYLHIIFNLLLVLVLIVGFLYVLKRIKFSRYGHSKYINLIQVVPVGSKEKLVLLEINKVFILVGVTANRIDMLHEFDQLNSISNETNKNEETSSKGFLEIMKNFKEKQSTIK